MMYDPKIFALLAQEPPKGYKAGIGRGDAGFTTSGDFGAVGEKGFQDDDNDTDRTINDKDDAGLLYDVEEEYDEEDEEADLVFAQIDRYMDEKRKKRREEKLVESVKEERKERPKIQQQFADLKRQLSSVSAEEWDAIPEIGDMSRKKQDKRQEKFTPVPDSILEAARSANEFNHSVSTTDGLASTFTGQMTDLKVLSATRGAVLSHRLDVAGKDNASGQTSIDPKGYLTSLSSMIMPSTSDISDYKKARILLQNILQTDEKRPEAWISAVRLEEFAGKTDKARELIQKAYIACPENDDIWLEAIRVCPNKQEIITRALQSRPSSVKVWMKAAQEEPDLPKRRAVLQQAIARLPKSLTLWKAAIEAEENEDDAKALLGRAVECVPDNVELWLALARLETHERARAVLNAARRACPTSHEIWIAAAKLEEAAGQMQSIPMIIQRAFIKLTESSIMMSRDMWMNEAKSAEKSGSFATSQAIVAACISLGIEEEDKMTTWTDDAEKAMNEGYIHVARAVYQCALTEFPKEEDLWLDAVNLERQHGTRESLESLLKSGVKACPYLETLWLMAAKEKWRENDVASARQILQEGFVANPNSEPIVLAAVKLESETGERERARLLLGKARSHVSSARVWMKSAVFERNEGNTALAMQYTKSALEKFPLFDKLYMVAGQLAEEQGDVDTARKFYADGMKLCSQSTPLYQLASLLEESQQNILRARAILERGRTRPESDVKLWVHSIRFESRHEGDAQRLMARALQLFPKEGTLWSLAIFMENPTLRKAKTIEAMKQCDSDPHVVVAVARYLADQRALDKARQWMERGLGLNTDIGDHWAYYWLFEKTYGTEELVKKIEDRCVKMEPHHGEVWPRIAKSPKNARKSVLEVLHLVAEELATKVM